MQPRRLPEHLHAPSPDAGRERREIKALSAEALAQLRDGEGMGLEVGEAMSREARRLGASIIEHERHLDQAFREATVDEARLRTLVAEIARLQGELRVTHLAAHLRVRELLSAEQVMRYDQLRGYAR